MLGLVSIGPRKIKDGKKYDHLFPQTPGQYSIVIPNGDLKDTVKQMRHIVRIYHTDCKELANKLKASTVKETCKNVFDFCYNHMQYKLDKDGVEELRRPARAWADRESGIDCDCYSIFISSILTCLGIDHKLRITKYAADWQHVYIVVNDARLSGPSNEIVIDPVLDTFNYQKPFSDKMDYTMQTKTSLGLPIAFLNGHDDDKYALGCNCAADQALAGILSGSDFNDVFSSLGDASNVDANIAIKEFEDSVYKHILATRNYIQQNPLSVATYGTAKPNLKMLNYLLENWADPKKREQALNILVEQEAEWNKNGLGSLGDLGKLQLFKKIKEGLQNVGEKIKDVAQNAGEGIKNIAGNVKDFVQKVGKGIVAHNPLSMAARGGFLLAMKLNILRIGSRLYPAFLTESEAKSKGISSSDWQKAQMVWKSFGTRWEKIGGKRETLKEAIETGRAKKFLNGLGELGEPATASLALLASAPLLVEGYQDLKEAGLISDGTKVSADDAAAEKEMDSLVAKEGKTEEGKKGIIKKIVEFFRKRKTNFDSAAEVAAKSITEEDIEENTGVTDNSDVSDVEEFIEERKSRDEIPPEDLPAEPGFLEQAKTFVKENPGKTVLTAAILTYAFVPPVRNAVNGALGFGKKTSLSGPSARRKRKLRAKKSVAAKKTVAKKSTTYKKVKKVKLK